LNKPNFFDNRCFVKSRLTPPTLVAWLVAVCAAALMLGCASAPPPAPVPAVKAAPTRAERVTAALSTLGFEKQDDGWYLTLPAPLVFAFDSDTVSDTGRSDVARVARQLRELDVDRVLVYGHTDNVGTAQYNQTLSQRRAEAIVRVLADSEFPASRINAKGLASSVAIAPNTTPEGRAKNRRVVIVVQID
jgi:outer membrane protein OmpA-like peptidoglycan-associated protein